MKHALKQCILFTLVLALILGFAATASAVYIDVNAKEGRHVVYLSGKNSKFVDFTIATWKGSKTFTIKKPTIVPGTSGASLCRFDSSQTTSTSVPSHPADNLEGGSVGPYYDGSASVRLNIEKAGTAKIKYKIDGKTKTIDLVIKPYVNPVKCVTLNGINDGNSFAAMTKTKNYMDPNAALSLKAKTTGAKLKMTAADGWKIKSLSLESQYGSMRSISRSSPTNSAAITWGTLYANRNYKITACLVNTKNGATQTVGYYIHGVKSADRYL